MTARKSTLRSLGVALGGVVLLAGTVQADAPVTKRLTLTQVVDAAGSDSPDLVIAQASVSAAEAKVQSTHSLRFPVLSVDANVLMWNDDVTINFAPGASLVAREQVTSSAGATVAWPITGFFALGRLERIYKAGVRQAKAQVDASRADVAQKAAQAYLGALQARAGVQIAASAVTQLDAQITRMQALQKSGVANKVDVMRLESARAQAEQRRLEAEDGQAQAEDALAMILGLPAGSRIETVDDLPEVLPPPPWSEEQAIELAIKQRPELRAAKEQAEQAEGAVLIQKADYLPQVTAVANYTHVEGQGPFVEKDAAYVGLTLKWNLWDWGANAADVRGAKATARQAKLAAIRAADGVVIDVRGKVRTAASKYKELAVAKQGADTAEEAYKLMNLRFQGGDAVTADVIDAESEVTRARLAYANARYEYALALVNLARAVGAAPLAGLNASKGQ